MNEELAEKCRLTDEEIAKLTKPGPYETYFSHYPHIVAQAQLAKAIPLISAEAEKVGREKEREWLLSNQYRDEGIEGRVAEARKQEWRRVGDRLPIGRWNVNHPHLSEEVLIANSCSVNIGFYNRDDERWYVDVPAKMERIDKITHWMPLPVNPHTIRECEYEAADVEFNERVRQALKEGGKEA